MTGYDIATAREAVPVIKAWLEYQRRFLRTPGVQVAIRVGTELIMSEAYGFSDEVEQTPLRTDHLFRIASHSKTFTATAIMQLVEAEKIRLDDAIATWVPELVDTEIAAVTIRELLGHQGGVIRDGVDKDFWQLMDPFPAKEDLLALCRDHGRVFAANEHFKYTNVGFSLLGLAIEAASGVPYNDYVRNEIVATLGLSNTGPEWEPARAEQYAAGHTGLIDGGEPRETIGHVDTRAMASATGFYSTAEDLTRYGAAHFFGATDLISDASKRLIQRPESKVISHGTEQGQYGLGLDLTTIDDRTLVGHSGGYPGHITRTFIDPHDQLVVSVLTNCIGGPAGVLATGVIKLLNLAAKQHHLADAPADIDLSRFAGLFANLMGVMQVGVLGGRLVGFFAAAPDPTAAYDELQVIDQDNLALRPEAGFGPVGERIEYTWSAKGVPDVVRYCGSSRWPIETFLARRSAQIAAAAG